MRSGELRGTICLLAVSVGHSASVFPRTSLRLVFSFHQPAAGRVVPAAGVSFAFTSSRSQLCRRLAVGKIRSVDPHAVHDDRQLAGQGDRCRFEAVALGQSHGPCLGAAPLAAPGQHRHRRLEQERPERRISALADSARAVGLAGGVASGRQPDMYPHVAGFLEAKRIVDLGAESQRRNDADAGHRHQPCADIACSGDGGASFVQRLLLGQQIVPGIQHREYHLLEELVLGGDGSRHFGRIRRRRYAADLDT